MFKMFRSVSILMLSLFSAAFAQSNTSSLLANVTRAFSQAHIVPDVLKTFAPTALLNITFMDSFTMQPLNVTPGDLLTMPQTTIEPTFSLVSNSPSLIANQTFVLAMVDPDAPTPQNANESEFLHFLGGDFRVNATSPNPMLLSNQSAALMEFFSPSPPMGSDPHRYVLVAYSQPPTFADDARGIINATTQRNNFNLSTFASTLKLGNATAGNFFLVGPDNATSVSSSSPSPSSTTSPTNLPTTGIADPVSTSASAASTGTSSSGEVRAPVSEGMRLGIAISVAFTLFNAF